MFYYLFTGTGRNEEGVDADFDADDGEAHPSMR